MVATAAGTISTGDAEIDSIMVMMYEGWTRRDPSVVLPLFADRTDLVIWGSDAWERIEGRSEAEKEFGSWLASCPPWTRVAPVKRTAHVKGDIAWLADEVDGAWTSDSTSGSGTYRATIVLERESSGWKMVHVNISIPD